MPYALDSKVLNRLVIKQQYDANASFVNMFVMRGTAFEMVLSKPTFWVLTLLHVLLYFLAEFHDCTEQNAVANCVETKEAFVNNPLEISDLSMLVSLTTFFIVFYNGNCYARYKEMYGAQVAIQGKIHNIGLYLRSYFMTPGTRWTVIRYMLASHFIFYWSIKRRFFDWKNSQYKESPGSFEDLIHKQLLPRGVLVSTEAKEIAKYQGNKHKLLFAWTLIALKRIMQQPPPAGEKGNHMLSTEYEQTALVTNLKEEIVEMRAAIGLIDNSMLFPIPFQYYHIVNVTMMILLTLLSYAFLFINKKEGSPFSLLAYPLVLMVLLGLREVANAMSDPFGTDACDFDQEAIYNGIYHETKILCEFPQEPFLDKLGDPSFNPARNPDGSLSEETGADASKSPPQGQEPMWPEADVQAIQREKDALKAELAYNPVSELVVKVNQLVSAQAEANRKIDQLDNIPRQIESANYAALDQIAKLENIIANKMGQLSDELAHEPYDIKYAGAGDINGEKVIPYASPASTHVGTGSVFRTVNQAVPRVPSTTGHTQNGELTYSIPPQPQRTRSDDLATAPRPPLPGRMGSGPGGR